MTRLKTPTTLLALAALVTLPLFGCATMVNGTQQDVEIRPLPAGGTHVKVTSLDGATVYDGDGPANVHLKRSQDYKLTITKPGYQPETVQISSGTTWWFLLPMFTITGPFELISVFDGAIYAYDEDGIEVTLFRQGRKPQGAVAYDP
jgi:hypothetical protein